MTIKSRTEKVVQILGNRACLVVVDIYEPEVSRGTVLCLHGFIGNASDFEKLGVFLAENGVRVICPDLLGRGRSTFLEDPDAYGVRTHLETIRTVLSRFGSGQDSIIGSGGGATLALMFTLLANYAPRRLILADMILTSNPALSALSQMLMEILNGAYEEPGDIDRMWKEEGDVLGLGTGQRNHPSLVKYLKRTEDGYRLACDKVIAFSLDNPMSFDFSPALTGVKTPSLLLYGQGSPVYDENAVSRVTGANTRIKCIPELGPFDTVVFDEFHVFSTIMGFLSGKY